jgi:hypothetical protein
MDAPRRTCNIERRSTSASVKWCPVNCDAQASLLHGGDLPQAAAANLLPLNKSEIESSSPLPNQCPWRGYAVSGRSQDRYLLVAPCFELLVASLTSLQPLRAYLGAYIG